MDNIFPSYYDNSNGSLYKLADERNWNSYIFDIVKRLDRGGKKDPIFLEIKKSICVLKLYKKEINPQKKLLKDYKQIDRDWSLFMRIFVKLLESNEIDTCIKLLEFWQD